MFPQTVKLSFADLFLALVIVNVIKPVVEISQPECCTVQQHHSFNGRFLRQYQYQNVSMLDFIAARIMERWW